jgi:DNA sulfur modification protein DndD
MRLTKIVLNNFKVFHGEHVIDCSVDDNFAKPLILIGGPNGAGKTSILESIKLCFFGSLNKQLLKPYSNSYNKLLWDVHNKTTRNIGNKFSISVDFCDNKIRDIDVFSIKREWTLLGEQKYKEELYLLANGVLRNDIDQSDFQREINEIFPIGVSELLFFDSENFNRIPDFLENGFITSLNKFMGIDIYNQLNDDLKKVKRSHLSEIDSEVSKLYKLTTDKIEKDQVKKKDLIEQSAIIKKSINKFLNSISIFKEKLSKESGELTFIAQEIERTKADLSSQHKIMRNDYHRFYSNSMPFILAKELCNNLFNTLNVEEIAKERRIINKEIKKIKKDLFLFTSKNIPLKYNQILNKKWEEITESKQIRQKIIHDNSPGESKFIINTVTSIIKGGNDKLEKIKTNFKRYKSDLASLRKKKNTLNPDGPGISLFNKIDELEIAIEKEKSKLVYLEIESKTTDDSIKSLTLQESSLKNKLKLQGVEQEKTDLLERSSNMLLGFSQSLTEIRFKRLKNMFLKTFKSLSSKNSKISHLVIDQDKRKLHFLDSNNNRLGIKDFSAGESELVIFSLLWAVNESADTRYPIVTDSPFNRLDKEHRVNFINHILKKSKSQIIFLSTDEEIQNIDYYGLNDYIETNYLITYDDHSETSKIKESYFS